MSRPDKSDVVAEIEKDVADHAVIHAILPTGESDVLWYYLVIFEEPHRDAGEGDVPADATLLKERYFQYPKGVGWAEEEYTATFITNGINRRNEGGLAQRLIRAYARADNFDTLDGAPADPLWIDE